MSSKRARYSNNSPKCIRCMCELVEDFQLIFDDTGLELELQKLLGICFDMDVKISTNEIQALCEDCLNRLIDTYDVIQRNEEAQKKISKRIKIEEAVKAEVLTDSQSSNFECEYASDYDIFKDVNKSSEISDQEYESYSRNLKKKTKGKRGRPKGSKKKFLKTNTRKTVPKPVKKVSRIKRRRNSSGSGNFEETEYLRDEASEDAFETRDAICAEIANEVPGENKLEKSAEVDLGNSSKYADDDITDDKFENEEEYANTKDDSRNSYQDEPDSELKFNHIDYLDEFDEHLDFKEYKKRVVQSRFQDVCFPEGIICRICSAIVGSHLEMLKHTIEKHCVEDFAYPCIIDGDCESLTSKEDLSIHLVFKHYDLNSLVLYCKCPECEKRFNDFPSYNKHSCLQQPNVSRRKVDCEKCGESFTSNKRYRFHLQFHLENRRPKACLICDKLFRDQDEFFEHVTYSHEKVNGRLCLRCDKVFTTDETYKNHEATHKAERPYGCILCPRSYIHKHYLNDHMIANHGAESPFKCHICKNYFTSKAVLTNHLSSHNKPKPTEVICCNACGLVAEDEKEAENHLEEHEDGEVHTITDIIDKAYCCEYCEVAFNSIDNLLQHRILHSKKSFDCVKCNESFDDCKDLKNHKLLHLDYPVKRNIFPVIRHYVCDLPGCTRSYANWLSLKTHKKHHQLIRPVKCPKCKVNFDNAKDFDEHMDKIHNGYDYDCQFCDKTYSTKLALGVHISRKHSSEQYQCDSCSYSYPTEELLEKHINTMHKDIPCEICGAVLKNLRNHQLHMRVVHEKEKRYFCKFCEKGFFKNCDVIAHEQAVHLKVKKYKCDLCPYEAVYKGAFTVHMRAHRNENPFVCNLCGRGFRKKYSLKVHIKRHNNIRDFKCPFEGCEYAYAEKTNLTLHIRLKHGENGSSGPQRRRSITRSTFFNVPSSKVFVDDDDGLNFSSDDELQRNIEERQDFAEETNPDEPSQCGFEEDISDPAVAIQMNLDHDYIIEYRDGNEEEMENCDIAEVEVDWSGMAE